MTKKAPKLRIVEDHADPALDGEPIAANDALTDERLAVGGIIAIKGYMRTSATKEALKAREKREKKANNGIKQTGVDVPDIDEARKAIRDAAEALREGRMTPLEIVQAVSGPISDNGEVFPLSKQLSEVQFILIKGGVKAWCIRRVLSWK